MTSAQTWSIALISSWTQTRSARTKSWVANCVTNIDLWHTSLEATFDKWARNPEAEPVAALRQRLEAGLLRLEHRIKEALNRAGSDVSQEEGENFFWLLGGYRGVSEAALAYAGAAQTINWSHWREERFS